MDLDYNRTLPPSRIRTTRPIASQLGTTKLPTPKMKAIEKFKKGGAAPIPNLVRGIYRGESFHELLALQASERGSTHDRDRGVTMGNLIARQISQVEGTRDSKYKQRENSLSGKTAAISQLPARSKPSTKTPDYNWNNTNPTSSLSKKRKFEQNEFDPEAEVGRCKCPACTSKKRKVEPKVREEPKSTMLPKPKCNNVICLCGKCQRPNSNPRSKMKYGGQEKLQLNGKTAGNPRPSVQSKTFGKFILSQRNLLDCWQIKLPINVHKIKVKTPAILAIM